MEASAARLPNRIIHRGKERGNAKAAIGYSLRPQGTDRPREANPYRCDGGVTRRRLLQTPFNPRRILVYSSSVMSAEQTVRFVCDSGGEEDSGSPAAEDPTGRQIGAAFHPHA